jgi:molybdopterin molybdotransferase
VSVGDYDVTRRVLVQLGRVEAYTVAAKPGKPQVFGHIGETPVFGLPGNPVSSLVVFDTFVLPALKRMAGRRELFWPTFYARLEEPLTRRGGRTEFVRVHLAVVDGEWVARSTGPQGSGVLSSMVRANGYAILPPQTETLAAGQVVPCQLWKRNE